MRGLREEAPTPIRFLLADWSSGSLLIESASARTYAHCPTLSAEALPIKANDYTRAIGRAGAGVQIDSDRRYDRDGRALI
jgi:hypothetical protein